MRSDTCIVSADSQTFRCLWRGRLRLGSEKVLAGDMVEIEQRSGAWVVTGVLPRKNSLVRPPFSNVDQVVVVFTLIEPEVDTVVVDRLLVAVEREEISAAIVVNKTDLYGEAQREQLQKVTDAYEKAGYPVMLTSAATGSGLDSLSGILRGKVSVLAGPSGVGKSLLISRLTGTLQPVGDLSRTGSGRHTTKWVSLLKVGDDAYLADTPGFQKVDLVSVEPEKLGYYFREMADLAPRCRFPRCLHKTEPGCSVKESVELGRISRLRYDNYLKLLEECLEAWRSRYG